MLSALLVAVAVAARMAHAGDLAGLCADGLFAAEPLCASAIGNVTASDAILDAALVCECFGATLSSATGECATFLDAVVNGPSCSTFDDSLCYDLVVAAESSAGLTLFPAPAAPSVDECNAFQDVPNECRLFMNRELWTASNVTADADAAMNAISVQCATWSQTETTTATPTHSMTHSESATRSAAPTHSMTHSATESAVAPGSVGDPILVDFAGHRFMGGARGRTEYLLYAAADGAETITMTTGVAKGAEGGFFAVAVTVARAGCGSVRVAADETEEHSAEVTGDACMTARVARGDDGMVVVPLGDQGAALAVYPHHQGDSPAFLNMRLLAATPAFRAGCTGMLCDEVHGDVEA